MLGKKGISLPIRILVVIIVSIIVLAGILAIYSGTVPIGGKQMKCETNIRSRCMNITRNKDCPDVNENANIPGCENTINLTKQCCV